MIKSGADPIEVKKYIHAGHRKNLRERFDRAGLEGFNDHEILELLLTYVIPFKDVKPAAHALLDRFGSVSKVLDAESSELMEIPGIKERSAVFFRLIREVAKKTMREAIPRAESLKNSAQVKEFLIREIGHEPRESFYVIFLNSQNHLIHHERLQQGTLNQTAVYPREIFEKALRLRAAALIFAHNHPSGVLQPSTEDVRLNQKLAEAAKLFQMSVLDHVIVSSEGHYSFHDAGLL